MANTIFTVYLRKIVKILIPKIWHVFLNDFTCAASEEFSTSFASSRFPAFPVIFKSSFSIKKISCLYLQKVIASCLSMKCSREGFLFQQIVLILNTSKYFVDFHVIGISCQCFSVKNGSHRYSALKKKSGYSLLSNLSLQTCNEISS